MVDGVTVGVLEDAPLLEPVDPVLAEPAPVPGEELLPEAEVEATPGSWCATTPKITAVAAAAVAVTHRAARRGRARARSLLSAGRRSNGWCGEVALIGIDPAPSP